MSVAPVVSVLACGTVLLIIAEIVIYCIFQQLLNGIGKKVP
jgi:hypothetical protein